MTTVERVSLLAAIADATALREGPEGVASILRAVFRSGPLPLRDLARIVRLPLPVAGAVRRELETAGLFVRGAGVELSAEGRDFCANVLALAARHDPACPTCGGGGIVIDELFRPLVAIMETHIRNGPPVDVRLDQAPCTAETAIRRASAMHEAGALEGRRIAILGDDDSLSIALSLVGRAIGGPAKRIVVFEIDEKRVEYLGRAAHHHDLAIEIVPHDLRDPLAPEFHGAFDVFETDPPYTLPGMALFVTRGLEALQEETGLPGFLSYGDLAPDDQLALLERLASLGLAATRIRPSFNRYEGASILGSVGQLLDLRTTSRPRIDAAGVRFEASIYTGQIRQRLRRYRCAQCGFTIEIGSGKRFETVETLKGTGCPNCGGQTFRRDAKRS